MPALYWTQLSRFHQKTETESRLRNAVFEMKDRTRDNVQTCDSYTFMASLESNSVMLSFSFAPYININPIRGSPVTTAGRVFGRLAANTLNMQSRTADNGWSSSLGVWRWANYYLP
jgi:hypothetical protein